MSVSPLLWRRGPRSGFKLAEAKGVYALFLGNGAILPGIDRGEQGLLYIGLAANRRGLLGRCHFNARTVNHSPRKSLAVLLMDELALKPVLVTKPNSGDTWGLEPVSDARLTAWMHENLELAIECCDNPDARETELVGQFAPPLNLKKCVQTEQHLKISAARNWVKASLRRGAETISTAQAKRSNKRSAIGPARATIPTEADIPLPCRFSVTQMDTAEAIAARYGLDPKRYRQRMRDTIRWYRKPQVWTFAVDSSEWLDMIAVAERMTGRG